jgi:hypothetical protein
MSKLTTLAEGQLTAVGSITIELVEADENPHRGDCPMATTADRVTPSTLSRHRRHSDDFAGPLRFHLDQMGKSIMTTQQAQQSPCSTSKINYRRSPRT